MQKHNRSAHRIRCNYVPCIITPPLFEKLLVGACPPQPGRNCIRPSWLGPAPTHSALTRRDRQGDQNTQMSDYAGASFTNIIYTKLSTSPSSKICRIINLFQHCQIYLAPQFIVIAGFLFSRRRHDDAPMLSPVFLCLCPRSLSSTPIGKREAVIQPYFLQSNKIPC